MPFYAGHLTQRQVIIHHPQKGPLCFVLIYAGHLTQRQVIIHHPQKGPLCFVRFYVGHLIQRQAAFFSSKKVHSDLCKSTLITWPSTM